MFFQWIKLLKEKKKKVCDFWFLSQTFQQYTDESPLDTSDCKTQKREKPSKNSNFIRKRNFLNKRVLYLQRVILKMSMDLHHQLQCWERRKSSLFYKLIHFSSSFIPQNVLFILHHPRRPHLSPFLPKNRPINSNIWFHQSSHQIRNFFLIFQIIYDSMFLSIGM